MTAREQRDQRRQDDAIESVADALLTVSALQTGTDPMAAYARARAALITVMQRSADDNYGPGAVRIVPTPSGGARIEYVVRQP